MRNSLNLLIVVTFLLSECEAQGNSSSMGISSNGTTNSSYCSLRDFQDAYDYEVRFGLFTQQDKCHDNIRKLLTTQFGPPTQWDIFNMMCKGSCREHLARYRRLQKFENMTGCTCSSTQIKCPMRTPDMLCATAEFCYDPDWYETFTCDTNACGRWATNEKDYRDARRACKMYLDAANSAVLAAGSVIALLVSAVALTWR